MDGVLQFLRRHRLDRVGAAYAVVAWALVQAASIALPAFDAPAWVMRWLIVVSILGFPLALALAWHFSEDEALPASARGLRRWVLPGILGLVFVLSLGQLALHWSRGTQSTAADAAAPRAAQASIAVLPFANLSGDPAKRYFSDGIAEQLIAELSRRPSLRVAARTSSFALAGGNADVKTIGRALGVGAVVEGSVREDGNRVRISAELIDAHDGFQIWSESYDRDLTNILSLQDEIARAISRALSRKLTGHDDAAPAPEPAKPKIDPQAYRQYLEGQFYFAQRSESGITRSVALFEEAARRAPDFADGFAALGNAHATLALNFGHGGETVPATVAIDRALALDPDNPKALMAHMTVSLVNWQWRAAADDLARIEARDPGTPGLWHSKGVFMSYMGLTRLALTAVEKAVRQDPLSYIDRYNLALYLTILGRHGDALKVAREGAAIQPGNAEGQQLLCEVYAAKRDLKEAGRIKMQLDSTPGPDAQLPAIACAYYIAQAAKDTKTLRALADGASAGFPGNGVGAYDLAIAYAQAGDNAKAIGWLETAYETREPQLFAMPYSNPEAKALYADPRWKTFRDKPAFHDWEKARAEIAKRFDLGE